MKTGLWIALALVLVVYAAFVVANNGDHVTLNLLFVRLDLVPVWQILLITLLGGGAIATLLFTLPFVRLRLRVRSQSREIRRLEQEVHGLRTLPLTETDEPGAARSAREG
jgi:uncharacterized membrane protein YciS (DUF1049 family)